MLQNWFVGRQKAVTDALHKSEARFEPSLVVVIKKQAANASRLIAVLEIEVVIAPLLKLGIVIRPEWITSLFCRLVPVNTVLHVGVVRCQVEAAAKPPYRFFIGLFCNKKPDVTMGGRHVGIVRMEYQ